MNRLPVPPPYSAGVFLTYKCTNTCKHCLYACSPRWSADWISEEDAEQVLVQLARAMRGQYPYPGRVGVNDGLHFTGGEPFLNFELLLCLTRIAQRVGIPTIFVETNGFWCTDDEGTRDKMLALKDAGMDGLFVSANPFILEQIPFERTERAVRISRQVFGENAIVYQRFFYNQFERMGLRGTLAFDAYVEQAGHGLHYVELFANGRVPYKMNHLFHSQPAHHFFGQSCERELIRDWHIHVDNYGNFVPGFCGGLTLGDARDLDSLYKGIDLDELPVLRTLLTDLADLYHLAQAYDYQERVDYISKCHLCLDIRRHLVQSGDFRELQPGAYYQHLED
jgi:hypothetical protein